MLMANDGLCLLLLLGAAGLEGLCALVVATFPFVLGALALRWLGRALASDVSTEVARHKAYDAANRVAMAHWMARRHRP